MSAQMIRTGRFIAANDNDVHLDLGFIPDYFELLTGLANTSPNIIKWWREQFVSEASDKYGILHTGTSGVITVPNSQFAIEPYTTVNQGVWLQHPANDALKIFRKPTLYYDASAYTDWTNYRARAGSTMDTAIAGDCTWPITKNGFVYELTTATGQPNAEPTWPTIPGVSVTDQASNVWICRKEQSGVYSPKGVTIHEDFMVDGEPCLYLAILGIERTNHGDAENFYPGARE